jgi:hypothetical protein
MIDIIDLSTPEFKLNVHRLNCPHSNTYIKKVYGVWWNGEQSSEVVDELLVCRDCKDIIMRLSQERNNEVGYEY